MCEYTEWFELIQYFNNTVSQVGLFKLDYGYIKDLETPNRYLKLYLK